MLINTFAKVAHKLLASGTPLELQSGPGVGKTSIVHQIGATQSRVQGRPFGVVTVILTLYEAVDLRGFLMPTKGEDGELWARFTRPSVFPSKWNVKVYVDGRLAPDYDGPVPDVGIMFFDELAQADVDLQKAACQPILEGEIGEFKLLPGWVRWAASNRLEDGAGVVKRLRQLQNRMKTLPIEPSYAPWEDWAMRNGVHPLLISFAKVHPDHVFKDFVPKDPGPFCTPRSLVMCGQDLVAMREPHHGLERLPDDDVAYEIMTGWVGAGTAPVLATHLRLANDLPSIEDVAKNPRSCKIPNSLPTRYVLAMTLPHHLSKKTASAFITYMSRPEMDKEIQILFVTNAIRRGPEALSVPEFQRWVTDNKDLALIAFG